VVRVRLAAQGMSDHQKKLALTQLSNLNKVSEVLKKAITMPREQRTKTKATKKK